MKKVIILAGGRGERLRPYTEDRPKCMIPVMGRPLFSFTLQWLNAHGFTDVYLMSGWRHEVIKEHFGDGRKFGVNLNLIVEDEPLGRGGAMKKALSTIGPVTEPILAMNGDLITNLNLTNLAYVHGNSDSMATVVTVPLRSPYGIVDIGTDGNVTGFREKPELPFWINAGIYMISPKIFDLLPDRGDHEELTFPQLALQGKLGSFRSRDFWRTVDTVKDLGELRNELEQLFLGAFFNASPTTPAF